MRTKYAKFAMALLALAFVSVPLVSSAQQTTSSIRGTVTTPDGAGANATVRVTDTRTGSSRSVSTNAAGTFSASGLRVGGPYTVSIDSDAYADQTVNDIYVQLGDTYTFSVQLGRDVTEEIVVTAAAIKRAEVALGPSSSYNLADLEGAPAINRDIKDLIRIDPRIYVDEADVEGIQCNGTNPRFNSLTVDGVKLNDNFGLNRSGYPTQRMPFPYDAIQQVAVELAPFDVQYGGFTACNVNAVTKSGTNEFTGDVFFDFTSDSFTGDSLEGDSVPTGDFDEKRYGLAIGGPIIKDKLFFFAAYQKDEAADLFDRCAGDQSCGRPIAGTTQAQIDRITNIAQTLYSYDPGGAILTSPVEDEKYVIKLDWNINDNHRANVTYNYNEGSNLTESDGDDDEFEFSNHFYDRGGELEAYAAHLFSDWTDNLTTELRVGYSVLDNRVETQNAVGFPEMQIETYDAAGQRAIVYLGGDDSRQSNKLDYDTTTIKLAGSYILGNHVISAGYEMEELDISNLFVQHSIGEYRFDEMCDALNPDGCIDAFEALSPDDIYYGNAAGTNNPQDAAGSHSYGINTAYIQDEFTVSDNLTIVGGFAL